MQQRRLTSGELAQAVPAKMQALNRWVGHVNKQPLDVVRGGRASTSDPTTWASFGTALEWYQTHAGDDPTAGIGFVFTAGDGLVFLDLDNALDDSGQVKPWALSLVSRLRHGTYLEVSPSGKGLHAFLESELPRSEGVTGARTQPDGACGSEKVEVYAERRFSTVTGWQWADSPCECGAMQDELNSILLETGLGEKLLRESATPTSRSLTDSEARAADVDEDQETDIGTARAALEHIDPDCGYDDWLQIGMALKAGFGDDGLALWDEWSQGGDKYQAGEPEAKWRSFRRGGVGLGTLFMRALRGGWDGRREALDEFAGVEVPKAAEGSEVTQRAEGIPYHVKIVGVGKRSFEEYVKGPENVYLYFSRDVKWRGRLRWNERKGEVELNGKPLENHNLVDLSGAVSRAMDWSPAVSEGLVYSAVVRAARTQSYDPVRDWLKSLEWDGQERIQGFCKAVGLEDNETTRRYVKLWMLGAVARAFEPGCSMPYVLVLCGPQGAGKSRLAQALAVRPEWYHESAVTLGDKDAYLATLGPWVMEIAELAGMRRADQEKVKAFVSEKESRFRAPYDRVQVTHPRRLVFIATTNDEEYGRDATGARRWLDVAVTGEMHIPGEEVMRQLWAEAVVCYQRGDRRYETAEEMAETNARGEARRELDTVEVAADEVIRELARTGATTVAEVADMLRTRNVQLHSSASRTVTTALRKAGWVQRKVRLPGSRQEHRVWAYPGSGEEAWRAAVDRRRGFQAEDH